MAPDTAQPVACTPQAEGGGNPPGGTRGFGLQAIKASGGTVVVRDPDSAEFSGMPRAALHSVAADHVLALEAIDPALVRLVTGAARG